MTTVVRPVARSWPGPLPDSIGIWPLLAALLVLFMLPAASIISNSVTEPENAGLSNFHAVLSDPTFAIFAINTVRTAVLVSIVCAALGYFYAYVMYRSSPGVRAILIFCALLPLCTSLLVRSFAWTVILRDTGIVNWILINTGVVSQPVGLLRTSFAVTVGMAQILLPFSIFPAYVSMARFDGTLMRASRSLGAGPVRSFLEVFFPATRIGLVAGTVLVFVLSLGYFITPVLLGGPGDQPIAVLIDAQVTSLLDWGAAGAMSAIVTFFVLLFLAIGWRAVSRIFFA